MCSSEVKQDGDDRDKGTGDVLAESGRIFTDDIVDEISTDAGGTVGMSGK